MALKLKFTLFLVLLVAFFAADVIVGSTGVVWPWGDQAAGEITRRILFDFRLPKAIVALLAGAALSASGLLMQTVFRNPLAGPYVLGVSSGASRGVAIFLLGLPMLGSAGLLLAALSVKPLNLLLLGEGYARSMGVSIRQVRGVIFLATSLLAGSVTAFCGPIGFVGIAVPHVARMVFRRADHRILLPAAVLVGADMMLFCDLISQLPGTDLVLPVNTITALLGIPVVVMVVVNS